jgi:biotin transport system substrate-specific component
MHTRVEPLAGGTLLEAVTARADLSAAFRAVVVLFATVLTIVAAQVSIPLPFTPVPFTLQPMVVLLAGAALGPRLGMTSQMLYLALGIAGLPVFAASPLLPQGAARLIGPTGGYLMSYPFAAFVAGYLAGRGFDRRYLTSVLAMARACRDRLHLRRRLARVRRAARRPVSRDRDGLLPFIPADIIKMLHRRDDPAVRLALPALNQSPVASYR